MPSFKVTTAIALLATLTTAESLPSCTTTLTPDPQCCLGPPGHTATSYVDCEGCWLYTPYPTVCDLVRCAAPTGVQSDRTSTVTSCAASITPSIETHVRRQDGTITLDDPTATCTTTGTKTTPGCQDCGATAFPTTKTVGVDCGGCALQTVDFEVPESQSLPPETILLTLALPLPASPRRYWSSLGVVMMHSFDQVPGTCESVQSPCYQTPTANTDKLQSLKLAKLQRMRSIEMIAHSSGIRKHFVAAIDHARKHRAGVFHATLGTCFFTFSIFESGVVADGDFGHLLLDFLISFRGVALPFSLLRPLRLRLAAVSWNTETPRPLLHGQEYFSQQLVFLLLPRNLQQANKVPPNQSLKRRFALQIREIEIVPDVVEGWCWDRAGDVVFGEAPEGYGVFGGEVQVREGGVEGVVYAWWTICADLLSLMHTCLATTEKTKQHPFECLLFEKVKAMGLGRKSRPARTFHDATGSFRRHSAISMTVSQLMTDRHAMPSTSGSLECYAVHKLLCSLTASRWQSDSAAFWQSQK
ncbi:hypothetical protein M409DRAFT_55875 [Zasmidium cellare ATCC 36951]|uniref:Uncharacterized protein n=1 Tax=Zasmidium cellare ATCC 36951 TaxID=1080233 RepID=A0A6A6CHR6_ZASCE|nr:uncharacterized protein M409DRAFT_55875 [Zasmidium cellare ATCC 36951]KAF2165492.1 hypothetical protein M409DRAFT_55875 [Zasmidium cellare ATCC 36951]